MKNITPLEPGFYGMGIAPRMLDILWNLKFKAPTPIQQKAIPIAVEGKDVIGIAQTGTGKTLAFCIPMIQRLSQTKGRGLVVLPTRELAIQAEEVFKAVGKSIGLRTALLIGGASMNNQLKDLKKNPHVLIVTPGRLIDHLQQRKVDLRDIKVLVLDEADRMLDMGFAPQINQILKTVPSDRQTLLFSATMPPDIMKIASKYMELPISIEIAPSGTTAERVSQELFVVNREDKLKLLQRILEDFRGSVLVFSRTKHGASKITRTLKKIGHTAAEIHSDRSLSQRREALDGFKSGKYRVLVATDIAARGLDVKGIELVVNYDLPEHAEDYVHRIGRTGRAGEEGRAISIASPDQKKEVDAIERFTRSYLPVSTVPDLPVTQIAGQDRPSSGRRPGRRAAGRGAARPGRRRR
ncbi:MAG: DEAD/DEAH box helicase [Patescibacteria group bacterium]|nr:DEAD/DEAH box helicase [Patescibacteria group bacterium]